MEAPTDPLRAHKHTDSENDKAAINVVTSNIPQPESESDSNQITLITFSAPITEKETPSVSLELVISPHF